MAGGLIYQLFDLNYQATVTAITYFRIQAEIAHFATGRNGWLLPIHSLRIRRSWSTHGGGQTDDRIRSRLVRRRRRGGVRGLTQLWPNRFSRGQTGGPRVRRAGSAGRDTARELPVWTTADVAKLRCLCFARWAGPPHRPPIRWRTGRCISLRKMPS